MVDVGVTSVFYPVNLFLNTTTKAEPDISRLVPVIVLGNPGFPLAVLKLVRLIASA